MPEAGKPDFGVAVQECRKCGARGPYIGTGWDDHHCEPIVTGAILNSAEGVIDITERMHAQAMEAALHRKERVMRLAQALQRNMEGGVSGSYAAQQINELAREMGADIDVTSMSADMAPFYLFALSVAYLSE